MKDTFIVQTSTPERFFIKVYHDFLNSGLLSGKEQIIFIHLKQYINFKNDTGTVQEEVYPTLKTLAKNVKMSEKTIRTILQGLQKKGILEIKQQGRNKPNIYKINDSAAMWKAGNVEELKAAADEIEEKRMVEILTAKGYSISKEKEPDSVTPTKAKTEPSTKNNQYCDIDDTTQMKKSQGLEKYTIESIKEHFNYNDILQERPELEQDVGVIMNMLHVIMNTSKPEIRVAGREMPTQAAISKLMKLNKGLILYAIDKFAEQTGRVKNPAAYMLTILYNAPEQYHLDMKNRAINEKAKAGGGIKAKNKSGNGQSCRNSFHNFTQRTYDYDKLEQELLGGQPIIDNKF